MASIPPHPTPGYVPYNPGIINNRDDQWDGSSLSYESFGRIVAYKTLQKN